MSRQKLILVAAVGIALLTPVTGACDVSIVVGASLGRGPLVAHPVGPRVCVSSALRGRIFCAPPARRMIVTHPPHERFVRIGPPRHWPPLLRRHRGRHVVIHARPTCKVTPPLVTAEPTAITVWITNSNGSQTAVKLTRSGPGFTGPRGEWYPKMPTNEQLRIVYGF
ncbi:MAG: hypothetical protein JSU70_21135 [Phycisphaerales bacterium]|nr:MAG: hypothetical protein JSU70_21135 [Phycisphaerales bacterium]